MGFPHEFVGPHQMTRPQHHPYHDCQRGHWSGQIQSLDLNYSSSMSSDVSSMSSDDDCDDAKVICY
jgi:hypothetical protein